MDYWEEFKKTGRVDYYLMYKESADNEETKWMSLKQEELSQNVQTTENQTVC